MAATISGIVFNDLNSNGIFNGSEPGIANAFVVLVDTAGTCTQIQTDNNGNYSFSNISVAGGYTIYETVITPNACPPTQFTQPSGFTESTTPRQINLTVTSTQITNNTNITGNNFGHDNIPNTGCTYQAYQVQGSPSILSQVNLKTGTVTTLGTLNPSSDFLAIGYNVIDGNFWGFNISTSRVARISQNRTVTNLPAIPNLTIPVSYSVGDVSANGYLYLYLGSTGTATRFFVIDVNSNRGTYGRLVDPTNGFAEQTTSPFGVAFAATSLSDWAFNPKDSQLYAVTPNGKTLRIDPLTGQQTVLTTTPETVQSYGSHWFDNNNNLYVLDNNTGAIYRFAISGNNVIRTTFSNTGTSFTFSDGARCATSPLSLASLSSIKYGPSILDIGQTFTYTIVIKNTGNDTTINCLLIDTLPNGATFVSNSLAVNNISKPGSPEPPGVELGSIPVGTITVTFKAKVTTMPSPNPMINNSTQKYSYLDDTGTTIINNASYSNAVATQVNSAVLAGIVKFVDKSFVDCGEIITYTIVIPNSGNVTAQNVVFKDTIPSGTSFLTNSVFINNVQQIGVNPNSGIQLPNIAPGTTTTITFQVKVIC